MGGDSLSAAKFAHLIKDEFDVTLPLETILDADLTIEKLSQYIRSDAAAMKNKIDWKKEVHDVVDLQPFLADLDSTPMKFEFPPDKLNPSKIFITGCTGFVGSFTLQRLLDTTSAQIYCLARLSPQERKTKQGSEKEKEKEKEKEEEDKAETTRLLFAKIRGVLQRNLIWKDSYAERIVPVHGDLESEHHLGISEAEYAHLTSEIDIIFHVGATVNHILPYSSLKAANCGGTRQIIELAGNRYVSPPPSPFSLFG